MEAGIFLFSCAIVLAAFGGLGWYIATQKGRPEAEGLVLGLLFGPLGCLIEAILPSVAKARPIPREGLARPRVVAPEYREGWDAPLPEPTEDPAEALAMDVLNEVPATRRVRKGE